MKELMVSPNFGVALSIVAFWIGVKLNHKLKTPVCNPLIVAIVLIVGVLLVFDIPYDTKNVDTSNRCIYVKSVKGESVPTTNILNIYRKWIENRIKDVKNIKLVNMSHGAYIEGMENVG